MNFVAWIRSYNYFVLAIFILLAVILGVLNNLRLGTEDERRVPWFGSPAAASNSEDE